jgi:hypothetical protein
LRERIPTDRDRRGRFKPGNVARDAKLIRIAERVRQLRLDYDATAAQQQLLVVAARFLDDAERARSALVRTRASNAARRLLADIPRKPEPAPATMAELERRYRQKEAAHG